MKTYPFLDNLNKANSSQITEIKPFGEKGET
jgi:hypothetical protein